MRHENRIIGFALAVLAALACVVTAIAPAEGAGPPGPPRPHSNPASPPPEAPDVPDTPDAPDTADPGDPGPLPDLGGAPDEVGAPDQGSGGPETGAVPDPGSVPDPVGTPGPGMKPGRPQHGRPRQQEEGDQPGAASASAPTTGDMRRLGAQIFRGWAFDSCSAPDLGTMRAWRQSPYGAVGAYIGGRARSCAQPNLSAGWARSVVAMGWRILPVYVGSQSPCALERRERNYPIDTAHASANGAAEAADAARAAGALGLAKHSPVYLDIEAYDVRSDRCTEPVIAFTQAWNRALRARGYVPGFYSSADSGVAQLEVARRLGRPSLPDLMWFARWNVPPDVYGEAKLSRTAWSPHRRVHQFAGDIHESHGGKSLKIDRNLVDAPVAIMAGAKKNAGDPESADEDGPGTAWTEGKAPARSAARLPNRLGHPGRRSARAPLRFGPYAHAHPRPSAYARAYAPARVRLPERAGVPFVPVAVPGTTLVRNPVAGAVPGVPFPYPSVPSPFPAGLGVPSAGSWRSWPGAGAALRLP